MPDRPTPPGSFSDYLADGVPKQLDGSLAPFRRDVMETESEPTETEADSSDDDLEDFDDF